MKKQFLLLFAMLFVAFTTTAATLLTQDDTSWSWVAYLGNFTAFTASILLATGYVKTKILKVEDTAARWLSWVIAIIIAFASWTLNLGYFADMPNWIVVALTGLFGGLAANGIFKLEFAQVLLEAIGAQIKNKK